MKQQGLMDEVEAKKESEEKRPDVIEPAKS
jgi:hypothetical protein